jgi:predicted transcriptional regulator
MPKGVRDDNAEPGSKPLVIKLDPDLHVKLAAIAKQEDRPMHAQARVFIREAIMAFGDPD